MTAGTPNMEGRRVVVVGGTSGMGFATVRATAALGAEVIAAGRRPVARREPTPGVHQVEVDVTDEASVRDLFASVGELDHLLVTASPGALLDQDLAAARSFMDGEFFAAGPAPATPPPSSARRGERSPSSPAPPWPGRPPAAR
jgi:NAD(P)-dependent dehydrogenase (short-subunit alcohol dehydrogenase family)